jgi:hypothetical protein
VERITRKEQNEEINPICIGYIGKKYRGENKLMNKVIAQVIIILTPLIVSFFYPIQEIAYGIISIVKDPTKFDEMIRSIIDNKKVISIIWGILGTILIYYTIKRANKNKLFNTGAKYNDYPLWIYWVAARILGYEKVSLIRVPIYLQYQLLFKDLFPQVVVDDEVERREQAIEIIKRNMDEVSNEINLVLIDSYEIKEEEIPFDKVHLPTIIIRSGNQIDSNRSINPEFIKEVRKVTNIYCRTYSQLNVFSTTNTNHNKTIVNKCFKNGSRTGFANIIVYQASRTNYVFNEGYKVL